MNTLALSEANKKTLVIAHWFLIGETVYMNNYGEPYYATEKQWLGMDPRDAGFETSEYPEGSFTQNSEWFTEYEIVEHE